jgi:pyruvate kinase
MHRQRSTKIIATLGPASSSKEMIWNLFEGGADVFRLNFSHGSHADHADRMKAIRAIEKRTGRPIGVLADLQGPKIRIGKMSRGSATLKDGARFRLDLDDKPGTARRAPLPHPEVFAALDAEMALLIDDGRIRLTVNHCGPDFAECRVESGGVLKDRKGVNLPEAVLPVGPMTEKDRNDLRFALDLGVDWVALSFVQRPEDVAEVRRLIAGRASVMAKIEKPAALTRIEEIVELSDAIMVARGDLGVELPVEEVPALQKRLVRLAPSPASRWWWPRKCWNR